MDILHDLFSEQEMEAFKSVFPDAVDIEKLKQAGNVQITETEKDDIITKIITFTSFDGQTTFTKENSFYKYKAEEYKIKELKRLMNLAAAEDTVEGYKRAAKIKNQLDALLITL